MGAYLLKMLAGSLELTLVTELAIAGLYFSFGQRKKRAFGADGSGCPCAAGEPLGQAERRKYRLRLLLLVVLVNVLTNPAAVLTCWLGRVYLAPRLWLPLELAVEVTVVAVEGCVYRSFGRKPGWRTEHPIGLAVAANAVSWLLGVWLR